MLEVYVFFVELLKVELMGVKVLGDKGDVFLVDI